MQKLILADSQAIFLAGVANVLASIRDVRIVAQCTDQDRLFRAIRSFPGSVVFIASSLDPDWNSLYLLLQSVRSRAIVIAEANEVTENYTLIGFENVVFRNDSGEILKVCARRVFAGNSWISPGPNEKGISTSDTGGRVCKLSPKEMKVVALFALGYKNHEIASSLKTSQHSIQKCFRSIFGKIGVSDRLELFLFVVRHTQISAVVAKVSRNREDGQESFRGLHSR